MLICLQLFGRFREFSSTPVIELELELPDIATTADFRLAFEAWARHHWPSYPPDLLRSTAIATDSEILHATSALPANGRIALLPPVNGG